LQIAEPPLARD